MIKEYQHTLPILFVEDDPEDRMLTEDAMMEDQPDFPLRFLENGEQLLQYLNRKAPYASEKEFPMPGIIVMDLNMPRVDGREALAKIKKHPYLKSIPVIVLTTSSNASDIENCYKLGANSYITKPNNYQKLVETLKTIKHYWFEANSLPDIQQHD